MADMLAEVKGEVMRVGGLLFVLVLLAAGVWTGAWFYAADRAGDGVDAWIASEAPQGRRWTCPGRQVRGFPLALEISCDHPTFVGLAFGSQATASLQGARIRVGLRDPHRAILDLQAPLTFRSDDGATDFSAKWRQLILDVDGVPDAVASGTGSGAALSISGRFGGVDAAIPPVDTLDVALAGVAAAADPTVDFSMAASGIEVPAVDRAFGDAQPITSVLKGRLTPVVFEDAETPAALMEQWRQRGGSISFSSAQLSRGPSRMEASGALRLDDAHRIEGKLDASFTGAGPILRRYGINPNLVAAGSILNSLFGKRDAAAKPAAPDAINLPLQFRNGRLGVGPVVTGIALSPLY